MNIYDLPWPTAVIEVWLHARDPTVFQTPPTQTVSLGSDMISDHDVMNIHIC